MNHSPGQLAEIPYGVSFRDDPRPRLFVPLLDNGNGSVMASFMMDHIAAFGGREVNMIRASDSHANRGMNKIANAFLDSDCDIWINIDADIRFRKIDIDNLLSHVTGHSPLSLVYGIYPKKEDSAPPCICTFATVPQADPETGLAEVRRCGRGFMLVKRELLEAMKEDNGGPALRYHNHDKIEWDFFPSGVVTGAFSALTGFIHNEQNRQNGSDQIHSEHSVSSVENLDADGYPRREWISEDWFFCERARSLGYKTFVDTRIALGHVGSKEYRFGADQVTRMDSNISSWREIHGWFDYEDLYRKLAEDLIRKAGTQEKTVFVEVGCWLGRSIAAMASFCSELQAPGSQLPELHVVDTFCGDPANQTQQNILDAHGGSTEKAFRANMKALGIDVVVHAKKSKHAAQEFADESLDAVFIDGDHSYEGVLTDLYAWFRKVKPGGILAGHDIDEQGVSDAVEVFFKPGDGSAVERVGWCWKMTKL